MRNERSILIRAVHPKYTVLSAKGFYIFGNLRLARLGNTVREKIKIREDLRACGYILFLFALPSRKGRVWQSSARLSGNPSLDYIIHTDAFSHIYKVGTEAPSILLAATIDRTCFFDQSYIKENRTNMDIMYNIFEPDQVEVELVAHLRENKVYIEGNQTWTVKLSPLGGRGLFARRNIEQGELVYVDAPLLIGPRCISKHLPMCVTCYKNECPLFPCDRGCGLPVCSNDCENSPKHVNYECKYLRTLKPICGTNWSNDLLLAVTPIRALFMTDQQRRCMATFQSHQSLSNGHEVELLCRNVAEPVPEEDVKLLRHVCSAFNTNSFETIKVHDKERSSSLRALYPIGSLQNHCCVPNTRHHFDNEQRLYVTASLPIRAGDEITMTYNGLFWDTTMRRQFLHVTKHFWCYCERCSDPTEFGTMLGALFCAFENCNGVLLPREPLNPASPWDCEQCKKSVNSRQITSIRSGIAAIIEEYQFAKPRKVLKFIQKELRHLVPASNHFMMDLKFRIVSYFGRSADLSWKDLTDSELALKRSYCVDLLSILDTLRCGDCKKRGLILYELYCTNSEEVRRHQNTDDSSKNAQNFFTSNTVENEKLLAEATNILQNDIVAITARQNDEIFFQ